MYGILQPGPEIQGGVPYVRPTEIDDDGIRLSEVKRTSPEIAAQYRRATLRPGDLLITIVGTLGKIAVVPRELDGANITQSSARIRLESRIADTRYVRHVLRSQVAIRQYDRHRLGTGVPRLNIHHVRDLEIPLPPLPEQRRIAEVLDRAEALRAKRRAALAQLDSLTQSLFLDLFGDPTPQTLRFPLQPLETILKRPLQNGAYYPKESYTENGGVEMVHMSDAFYEVVPRGKLKRVTCPNGDLQKFALTEFDILVARRSLTIEGAAKPCLVPNSSEPLIFESSFIRVTPHPEKITALYLYHYLGNERVKQKCVRPYITQSTISGINQSSLERVPVIVPPLALQRDFARRVTAVEKLKVVQRISLAELDALFASLQHRAFRGEL